VARPRLPFAANVDASVMIVDIKLSQTPQDLLRQLRAIELSVPRRTDGRTSQHTETWTACHLLATLAKAGQLTYPVSVAHRDRPDFLLEAGSIKIGVEVTEAISEQYASATALAEREGLSDSVAPGHFGWGAPKRSAAELRELLRAERLVSDGWAADRPEQEWRSLC